MRSSMKNIKIIGKDANIRTQLASGRQSSLKTYQKLTYGSGPFSQFLVYELLTSLLGPIPGGMGFLLRKQFYPRLFKTFGRNVIIGRNVVFRHPRRISIGNNVTIDDNCLLDGRGGNRRIGIRLEDNVLVNRNCMLAAKSGSIQLGCRTSIGSNSVIVSMDGVEFGEAVLLAGGCYLSAGAYKIDEMRPIMDQDLYTTGPIQIGANAWLGARATILDGVRIGENAVVGACALVNKDIPAKSIAVGVPAKIIRMIE